MSTDLSFDPETGEIRERQPNLGEFTVSEISHALKRSIEDRFGHVRVRGEISGFRGPHSSGHCYFSLKDEGAKIDAVIWRGSFQPPALEIAGRPGGHRHRQAHVLSRQVVLSDHHRKC